MTLIRKLALALFLALLCSSYSNSQTIDYTTGNLINSGTAPTDTTSIWNNGVYVNTLCFQAGQAGNCGPNPSIRPGGNINFSYGTVDLNQVVNINKALAAGGTGVQLSGFNFGFTAKNGNGWDDARQDYLSAYVKLYNSGGGLAANYDYTSQTNQKYNWTNFNFSETFSSPVLASNFSNARVGFIGRDNNFWAGNYGPEIYNVSFSLKYSVDPCALNAAYSPNCAGFSNIVTGANVFNSNAWGQAMTQAVAINTALQNGGIGAQVHGIKYGFDWYVGSDQCTDSFLFWCTGWTNSNLNVNVRMTSASGQALLNKNYGYSGYYIGGHVEDKFLLPSTMNQTALGSVGMSSSGWGDAQAGNFRTQLIYTPDPCVADPLYSPMCKGYAVAYAKNLVLGSTVAAASAPSVAPAAAAPALAQAAPALAAPDPAQPQQPAQQAQQGLQPQQQGPAPAQDPNQNPTMAQDNPAQPSPQQAGPAPTNPQPAGGPPPTATAGAPAPGSGPVQAGPPQAGPSGGGSGPSKLAMSVVKSAQAKDQAMQQMAVQNAAKAFEGTMQSSQAASNAAVSMNQDMSANSATAAAQFSSQSTQASMQAAVQSSQGPQQQQQSSTQQQQVNRSVQQIQQTTATIQQDVQQQSSGTGLTISRNTFSYNPFNTMSSSSMLSAPVQPAPVYQPRLEARQLEVETPQMQVGNFGGIGKAGNPLSEMMMQQRFEMMQENIQQQTSTVNRNVQPNELAGGTDVAAMAQIPKGYEAYSLVILRDAPFYKPEAIYKDQRTVDNARVFRGLTGGSDAKHQQMVDSQYQLRN